MSSIVYSQALRIKRICSKDKWTRVHCRDSEDFFCLRGDNRKKVHRNILRALNPIVPQSSTFQLPQKIVSSPVLTYHPGLPDLKTLLRQSHTILQASTRMAEMFPEIPMVVSVVLRTSVTIW